MTILLLVLEQYQTEMNSVIKRLRLALSDLQLSCIVNIYGVAIKLFRFSNLSPTF